jgi:hypothetical protein
MEKICSNIYALGLDKDFLPTMLGTKFIKKQKLRN